jgi:hypothetical protein
MKIICSWCQKLIGYKCPMCGEPLQQPDKPEHQGDYMVCRPHLSYTTGREGDPRVTEATFTEVHFLIRHMLETHGICDDCAVTARQQANQKRLAELSQLGRFDSVKYFGISRGW